MFGWFKRFFRRDSITPDQVQHEHPVVREVVSRAFNTGNIVFAEIDENGEAKFIELKPRDKD